MPAISGPSMTCSGRSALEPRLLGVGVDVLGDAVDQRVRDALRDRQLAPGEVLLLGLLAGGAAAIALGERQQPLGRRRRGG